MQPEAAARAAPNLVYSAVRDEITTGDVLLFQGSSLLSKLIRWGSGSAYSHAGIAAWWDDRLLVFQATGRGTEVLPVSSAVDAYDGQVDWYALRSDKKFSPEQTQRLINQAVTLLGRAYARSGLLNLMWRMLWGRFRGRLDPKSCPDTLFCSQYVSYCYRAVDSDLVEGTDDGSTSPGDLAGSPLLEKRGILHADPQQKAQRQLSAGGVPGRPRSQVRK